MRIITGLYKGRHFDIPRSFKARPTTDFAKENIFNVLNAYVDFEDATALDLFAGTGSISLELLSRGCANVVSVEADREHANFIRQCTTKLAQTKVCLSVATCSASSKAAANSSISSLPTRHTPYLNWRKSLIWFSNTNYLNPTAYLFSSTEKATTSPNIPTLWNIEHTEALISVCLR